MAGQRQKPREELAFKRGGRDSVVDLVPEGDRIEAFEPPANLELCAEAREIWKLTVPLMPHVAKREYPALLRWIWWWDQWWTMAKAVEFAGATVTTAFGDKVSSEARWLERCEANIQRYEVQFGLQPQARMRLGLTAVKTETALERLRGGGGRKPPAKIGAA